MDDTVCLETFWLGELAHKHELDPSHIDLDPHGSVEEARWFGKADLRNLKVFPNRLQNSFWEHVESFASSENPFIGIV